MKAAVMLTSLLVLTPAAYAQSGGMAGMSHMGSMNGMQTPTPAPKSLSAKDCWVRLLPGSAPSAGYFTIDNAGSRPVSLTGVHTDAFGMSMLHQTSQDAQGRMGMAPVKTVSVPAQGQIRFAPGGYHVMLEKPAVPLHVGDKIALMLEFGNQALTTRCDVRSPSGK